MSVFFIQFLAVFVIDDAFYIYLALAAAGAAASFVGAQQSAKAAEDAGEAQKEAADAAARNEELQNAENLKRERLNKRRRLARLRANMGSSGLVNGGTMEDAFVETAGRMELEIQDSSRAGNLQASNIRNQGDMALFEARSQAIGTRISSYGTLLSDGTSIASMSAKSGKLSAPSAQS